MTPHDLMVIVTGQMFLWTGMALATTGKLLGPGYEKPVTVGPLWRFVFWALAAITIMRGLTILFPGKLVAVDRMSVMLPLEALAFLTLALIVMNVVMGVLNPPPALQRALRAFGFKVTDAAVIQMAMSLPVPGYGDSTEEREQNRAARLTILAVAVVTLVTLLAFLGANSSSAA